MPKAGNYVSTDSPQKKAGVDGAECILHVWNNPDLVSSFYGTHMLGAGSNTVYADGLSWAAGVGTTNKYGSGEYDFYTRNTNSAGNSWTAKLQRDGVWRNSYIPNAQISSAVVQLATDVQRWRCMDDIRDAGPRNDRNTARTGLSGLANKYLPCAAWEGEDGIKVRFSLAY